MTEQETATLFALDARLSADTFEVGDLALSRLLLMNDARFPWLILVPRQAGAAELTELSAEARAMLMEEIAAASTAVAELPGVEKINVGALGNIVRQLHVHVIGRNMTDAAWPGPVWGSGGAVRHAPDRARALVEQLRRLLIDQRR